MEITSSTFKESVYDIIEALQKEGKVKSVFCDSRNKEKANIYGGEGCLEVSPMTNIIENPLELFPVIPGRGNHFIMQLSEIIWVLHGSTKISEFFGQFASKAVQQFSHNTDNLYAAYGYRIRSQPKGNDVLAYVIQTLKNKITSRSAVIPLFNAKLDTMGGEHKPCATMVGFHLFSDKLDCILTLRANDLIKGYSAINFLEFAFIQAIVSFCLDVEVGRFINFTNTMHYYTGKASERVENIVKFKNIEGPELPISLNDLFNKSIASGERYESILEDVNKIYTNLNSSNKQIPKTTFTHPIFEYIYVVLAGVKTNQEIDVIIHKLPDFIVIPFLENQYRNNQKEVAKIVSKKYSKWSEAILWRDNL